MMHGAAARAAIISQLALLAAGCAPVQNSVPDTTASSTTGATAVSAAQRAAGWRPLFDGTSTSAWRGYKSQTFPAGWKIVDGVLTKSGSVEDIQTRDQFGNFQLALDWKLSPGGNAGIFYRGTEEYDHIYWSAPEYQLLDDAGHPDGKSRLTSAGADYGLYPSPAGVVKPAEEWNSTLIVVNGNTVQHWLNGQKLLEYAAQLTETMLLGIVALRTGQGSKILYDGEKMLVTNIPDANQYLTREYRAGWAV